MSDKNKQGDFIHIILAVIGLFVGLILDRDGGWLYGLLSGLALGLWLKASAQANRFQSELALLKNRFDDYLEQKQQIPTQPPEHQADISNIETAEAEFSESVTTRPEGIISDHQTAEESASSVSGQPASSQNDIELTEESQPTAPYINRPRAKISSITDIPMALDMGMDWLKNFFTTGNVLVKVGVLVLFFGIAFLVKYAAEQNVLPIELRLAGVAVVGITMLIIGWRLREKKTAYALVLQGGAVGILYLTVFTALRLYSLLPATLAFSILFVFVAFSAALAVFQNSRALAVLAVSGGFLAPILTSTGSGNHVGLFSYYLVLNLGIFGIAWFRSWRLLNVLGFMFTFIVATAWGVKYYSADYFSSTEPFLITFYLLYVAIAVLFAFKQPVQLKGYVDSTLVFGVPLVGFGLQAGMVSHIEYALAWSSLSLAALYIGLASVLWSRMSNDSRLLCEAFIAIGVMFATLTIPFALDARWTAGTWALEGAAAVWIGSRQGRVLPRLLGYALQFAGGIAFLSTIDYSTASDHFIINGHYIGALIVALSGLFVAWQLSLQKKDLQDSVKGLKALLQHEYKLSLVFLVWGMIWWYAAGVNEIEDKISTAFEPLSLILFFSFSVFSTQWLKQKLSWTQLYVPALILIPLLYLVFPFVMFENNHPFGNWNFISWTIAIATHFWVLKQYDNDSSRVTNFLHITGLWFIVFLLTVESSWQVEKYVTGGDVWWQVITGLVPAIFIYLMYRYGNRLKWPILKHQKTYQLTALMPMAIAIWGWFILMNLFNDGDTSPLYYLPLLNPLDLVLAIQLLVLIYWLRFPLAIESWGKRHWRFDYSPIMIALSIFLWLNTIWLRFAHQQLGINFELNDMLNSSLVQAGISILWGVTGLLCMIYGARKARRHVWISGAIVMAAVVIKLFMFDLANSGTVDRIVSFITVGILFLVVGYFAPVPPTNRSEQETDKKETSHEV